MGYRVLLLEDDKYTERAVADGAVLGDNHTVQCDEDAVSFNGALWEPFSSNALDDCRALLFPTETTLFSTKNKPVIKISGEESSHLQISDTNLLAQLAGDVLTVKRGKAFINGGLVLPGIYILQPGDAIFADETEIIYEHDHIACTGNRYICRLNRYVFGAEPFEGFPEYTRSPRIIKNEPTEAVDLIAPSYKDDKKKGKLLKLIAGPLVMLGITVAMGIFMNRGIFVVVSALGTVATTVMSVTNFFEDKREEKKKKEEATAAYDRYLLKQRKELHRLTSRFLESKRYHNPTVAQIEDMVSSYSERIYERSSNDADFLQISLGTSDCKPSFPIKASLETVETSKDPAYFEMRDIYYEFRTANNVPVAVDLKKAHLGLVGKQDYIRNQLMAIIAQATFLQSYHDIEIIALVNEDARDEFSWIKWYPHCKVKSINISGLISSEKQRDQVLGNITQELKARKQHRDEAKKDSLFLPHYVFIIDEPKLIINHSIMEFLQDNDASLGASIIYTTNLLSNLPENIHTVLMLDTNEQGRLLMNEGEVAKTEISTHKIDGVDLEAIARGIAPLRHNKGMASNIPESITFFDMYGVKHPHELPIKKLWDSNAAHKSLAVPLGVRAENDIVELNLHEKSHGPHGLVAGTTGSGKSEIMQSYILSLAVNFHPYEVGFLLIDYKGGGMANLFKDLPHLLGTITNLDGSESLRALASIKSELARRQRVFNDHEVNNINEYTKLFKAGKAKEPLPHLFIISDEFAELKKEQPDFMRELVSAARIGRSLGVHLILATQKPSGVVDDQIWSNSKFKLALKVQNESDSNEVLKTRDAARITQVGRAILQVGNNEIYEMFQSAWSGASYSEEKEKNDFDNRIYHVNELGQGVLLNEDLSENDGAKETAVTQLDATVAEIKKVYDSAKLKPVEKPWLPPLEEKIVSPYIDVKRVKDVAAISEVDLSVSLGMIDMPEQQAQKDYMHDFINDGNIAVFGASGFGKSTALINIALSLAVKNTPEMIHNYILDLGNSSLVPLKGLPHTADYLSFDDTEKLTKLFRMLADEIATRKKLFARESAINFKMYNAVASKKLPAIFFYIDNYDVVKEMGPDAEEFITKFTRDGVSLGVFTVITATRSNAVRYAVLNNFKNKICNFMFDVSEVYAIVGRSNYTLPEIRGRAMVKTADRYLMQEYLPVAFEDDISYTQNIRALVQRIKDSCSAPQLIGIPMLPETLEKEQLLAVVPKTRKGDVAIGLDAEAVLPQFFAAGASPQLIVGNPQTGKTNILKLIIEQLSGEIFISDSRNNELQGYAASKNVTYMSAAAEAKPFADKLREAIDARKVQFEASGKKQLPKAFYASLPKLSIIIDDVDCFVESCKDVAKDMETILEDSMLTGAVIYETTLPGKLKGFDNISKLLKNAMQGVVTGAPGDQMSFQLPVMRQYRPQIDMAFICKSGQHVLVKIPFVE